MMIQLKSFTKDAASRTKGLQLKTKLEHAIKEERNILTNLLLHFLTIAFLHLEFNMVLEQ